MTLRKVAPAAIAALAATVFWGCQAGAEKLDEAVFYNGPKFRLKLVRYYENYPLHYTGEVFRMQCSSARTTGSPGHKTQEAGWVTLGSGGAIGSESAMKLLERERANYILINENTLAWTGTGLSVSFDACGSFHSWYPTMLPIEVVEPAVKPDYCAPKGTVDCRHYDFLGDRAPRFSDLRTTPLGGVSFAVRSTAFKNGRVFQVTSSDFGRTWSVAPASAQ